MFRFLFLKNKFLDFSMSAINFVDIICIRNTKRLSRHSKKNLQKTKRQY